MEPNSQDGIYPITNLSDYLFKFCVNCYLHTHITINCDFYFVTYLEWPLGILQIEHHYKNTKKYFHIDEEKTQNIEHTADIMKKESLEILTLTSKANEAEENRVQI